MTENDIRNILLNDSKKEQFLNFISNMEPATRKEYLTPINEYIKPYLKGLIDKDEEETHIKLVESYTKSILDFNIDLSNIYNDVEIIKLYVELGKVRRIDLLDNFDIDKVINIVEQLNKPTNILEEDKYIYLTDVLDSERLNHTTMADYSVFMKKLIDNDLINESKSFEFRKNRVSTEIPNTLPDARIISKLPKEEKYSEYNRYFIKEYIHYLNQENIDPNNDELIIEIKRELLNPSSNLSKMTLDGLNFEPLDTDLSKFEINENFKDYDKLLETVGNCYKEKKNIPSSICKFLINGHINDKYKCSNVFAYKGMISGLFENILDQLHMGRYTIGYSTSPMKGLIHGQHLINSKSMKINNDRIDDFINEKDPFIFEVCFHELMHAYQWKKIKDNDISFIEYQMLKDIILSASKECNKYYDDNYKLVSNEMDARRYSSIFTTNLLGTIDRKYMEDYKEKALEIETMETKKIKELSKANKRKQGDKIVRLDDLFDQYILVTKEKFAKDNYRAINVEYNEKGEKKSVGEIIDSYQEGLFPSYGIKEGKISFINELLTRRFPKEANLVYDDITSILNTNIESDELQEVINKYMNTNIAISFNTTKDKEELATNLNSFLVEYEPKTKEQEQYINLINNKFLSKYNLQVQNCK